MFGLTIVPRSRGHECPLYGAEADSTATVRARAAISRRISSNHTLPVTSSKPSTRRIAVVSEGMRAVKATRLQSKLPVSISA